MKLNKSASRAVDIINLISKNEKSATITEISQALKIPKSSVFELVYTLAEKGFLEVENENLKTFNLGLKLFEAGAAFLAKTDLHREARPVLEDVAFKTGETAFLAVEDHGEIVYLEKVEGSSLVKTTANLGSRKPMYCTGLGKALLAACSEMAAKEIIKRQELTKRTQNTIANTEALLEEISQVRRRGYAIDNKEDDPELYCIAAPVYDRTGRAVAAISIASLASKMVEERRESFSNIVTDAAMNISRRLGFLGQKLYLE